MNSSVIGNEPSSRRFKKIKRELLDRYNIIKIANFNLKNLNYCNIKRLAATDVFIEKAQQKLTNRAYLFFTGGIAAWLGTIAALIYGTYYIGNYSLATAREEVGGVFDASSLTLLILRGTTITAYILGAAYVCFSLAKALFHEGTNSLNRRHALRFGRLYVYLTDGNIKFEELERAFNWNIENTTAFKDINTDPITKTLATKILETPADLLRAIHGPDRKEEVKEQAKDESKDQNQSSQAVRYQQKSGQNQNFQTRRQKR